MHEKEKIQSQDNIAEHLTKNFEMSIFDNCIEDICIDYAELGIDTVINEDFFREIPIVKTILSICKLGCNIHERNLLKQTIVFLNEFNKGKNSEKISKHREKLKENPKELEKELGRVLIILNRNIDYTKSEFLAKLYCAYINEEISWSDFCEFSDIIDSLFMSDISCLHDTYKQGGVKENMKISHRHDRLISIGLLANIQRGGALTWVIDSPENNEQILIDLTDIGRTFCHIVFD